MSSTIAIGMITHDDGRFLPQAIESLLNQSQGDFRLIILDDASTDDTLAIARGYAARDKRLAVVANETRQGCCPNYQAILDLAGPDVDYLAWAAGHDVHHPRWLETLAGVLDRDQEAVLAYPLTRRIGEYGEELGVPSPRCDTSGLSPRERVLAVARSGQGFGNMIYGLIRARALRRMCRAGGLPVHIVPDVRILMELALHGSFRQVEEELWLRRFFTPFSREVIERQLRMVFADPPAYACIPWPLAHFSSLVWRTVLHPAAGDLAQRRLGLALSRAYLGRYYWKIEASYPELWRTWLRPLNRGLARLGLI